MTSSTITLGKEVMVSDPCYTEPTWCQIKLTDVKPGVYHAYHKEHDSGDWYTKMCKKTLTTEGWGTYDQGIVSRSGFGDGSYTLYTARIDGEVVAMAVDFAVEEEPVIDFEFFR